MPKSIDTLLEDISTMLETGTVDASVDFDSIMESFLHNMEMSLKSLVTKSTRKTRTLKDKKLYVSEVGNPCLRKLWFSQRESEMTQVDKLDSTSILKFFLGDVYENILLALAKLSGHEVTHEQEKIKIELDNGWVIAGAVDCKIDGVTIDAKSASPYGFKKFASGKVHAQDTFGYMAQIFNYAYALGDEDGDYHGFLAIDKSSAEIALVKYRFARPNVHVYKDSLGKLTDSLEKETPPDIPFRTKKFGKTGNTMIPNVPCGYCKFKYECWKDRDIQGYQYSTGPVWLVDGVSTEPRVDKIPIPKD